MGLIESNNMGFIFNCRIGDSLNGVGRLSCEHKFNNRKEVN
ncbi:hypothetical protein GMES_4020 [Paraglaciecola mesophila KMM 241]|uniref:Uncharacterized protein n=1 Tax=Paraglaciecola mesophila KMM 241 TaxID=1128912 RepID=K6ZBH5_9ALTE|nr:hypothetical protein GMES_4020 [Paraglaciecola mesophila KMM 241]